MVFTYDMSHFESIWPWPTVLCARVRSQHRLGLSWYKTLAQSPISPLFIVTALLPTNTAIATATVTCLDIATAQALSSPYTTMSTLRQRVHGHPAVRSAAPPPASHASSGRVADTPTIRARRPTSSTPPPPPPVPPVPPVPVITITTPSPREDTLPLQRCGPAILDSDPNIPEYLRGTPFASVESLERHFAEFELRRNLLRPPPPPASEAPNRSVAVAVFRPASSVMPGMSLRLDTVSESPTPPGNPSRFIQHPSATQRIRLPNGLADLGRGDNDEEDSGLPPSSGLSSSLADTIRDYVNVRLPSMTGLDGTLQMPPGNIEREGDEHGYVSFAEFEERERARRLRTRELSEDEQVRADKLAARKARHEAMFAQQEEFAARPPRRNFFVEPPPLRDLYDCSHEPPPPKVPNRGRGWSKVQPWIPKPPPPEDRFFARERRKEMEAKLKAEKEALLNDMTKVSLHLCCYQCCWPISRCRADLSL